MHASEAPRRTPLHDRHLAAGARMVPFAGWQMPVQYAGIISEHRAVREHAGVFDVSHMGQLEVRGPGALDFLQSMLSNDLSRIGMGQAQYTLLLDDDGCPIDDLIAYRLDDDHLLLVVNASRVDDDREWLLAHLGDGTVLDDRSADMAMLALQGPAALDLVDLPQLAPFEFTRAEVCGVVGIVARTGYTGEPGVEIMVAPDKAGQLWDKLLAAGATPAGRMAIPWRGIPRPETRNATRRSWPPASRCLRSASAPTNFLRSSAHTQPRPASSAVRLRDRSLP